MSYERLQLTQKPNLEKLKKDRSISVAETDYFDLIEKKTGWKIDRQVVFPNQDRSIIVDGMLEGYNFVFEFDGYYHKSVEKQEKDRKRDEFLIAKCAVPFILRQRWIQFEHNYEIYKQKLEEETDEAIRSISCFIALENGKKQRALTNIQRSKLEKLYTESNTTLRGGEFSPKINNQNDVLCQK